MDNEKYLQIFKETGALLKGHFVLTSGRHSTTYFQCAKVLQYPEHLSHFAETINHYFKRIEIDAVISPAVGGIVFGTEVGRQLGVKTIFAERQNGKMTLRRGFSIENGEKFLVVEDVVTTGGSVREVMDIVDAYGGEVIGVGLAVDRSGGNIKLHNNQFAVTTQTALSYAPDEIPVELKNIPIEKPGSRSLK
ncbi:MAG: orotate phosphoribosyltransferase [Fidelibacterota bacterium]